MAKKANSGRLFIISIITISIALVILLITAMFLKEKTYYKVITKEKLTEISETDDRFALVLSRTWCGYCKTYKNDVLKKYKGDIPIYVIELDEEFFNTRNPNIIGGYKFEDFDRLDEYLISIGLEEFVNLLHSDEYMMNYETNRVQTPTTLIVEKKELIDYRFGVVSKEELDELIKK